MNASDSRAHFQDAHYIEEPRSNCVSRKRKSEEDEENVQDTKGEASNYVSNAHYIEEPRSNCVSRKRKSEDDEENVQDTKGEASNYMSKKGKE
ncbi:hypothetical protein V498_00007 [Pseudogymnoascus sp. VKM F-4517 (FW-2822)]|nr:hypothetical protein V498_00007 [Pseudogymnoascus sp. VKM F-4517 (FW-2822)]